MRFEHISLTWDSTQNVARNALLFLYQQVLQIKLPFLDEIQPAKRPERLPIVFRSTKTRFAFLPTLIEPISWFRHNSFAPSIVAILKTSGADRAAAS